MKVLSLSFIQDMATQGYFSHTSLDGRSPWDRARDQGISANGENIAAGRSSASGTLQQWKDSDGHCRNMMNPNFHVFAIGYFYESSSRYRYYWTQMFKSSDVSDLDTSCYPDFETTTLPATETETTSSSTDTTTTVTTESSTTATSTETGSTTTPVTSTQTDAASGTATGTGTGTGTGTATGTLSETTTGSSTGTDTAATGTGTSTTNSGTSLPSTETTLSSSLSTSISTSARSSASGTSTTSVAVASSEISQSSTSILAFSDTTQPIEETATTVTTVTTTAALESIQGKLVLEVSDPEGFLAASTELQGHAQTSTYLMDMGDIGNWVTMCSYMLFLGVGIHSMVEEDAFPGFRINRNNIRRWCKEHGIQGYSTYIRWTFVILFLESWHVTPEWLRIRLWDHFIQR